MNDQNEGQGQTYELTRVHNGFCTSSMQNVPKKKTSQVFKKCDYSFNVAVTPGVKACRSAVIRSAQSFSPRQFLQDQRQVNHSTV